VKCKQFHASEVQTDSLLNSRCFKAEDKQSLGTNQLLRLLSWGMWRLMFW